MLSMFPSSTATFAEAAIQEAITNVAEWSRRRNLILNASIFEVAFFAKNSKEAHWQPSKQLDGASLNTTSRPKLLGVTIGRALSFGPHVAAVVSKTSYRCRVLASLTFKKLGLEEKSTPQGLSGPSSHCYQLRCSSLATLAGPNPIGPARTLPKQSSPHHHRTAQTTPLDAFRIDTGVPSIATQAQQQTVVAYEKAHRLPTNHPHRTLLEEPCRRRLKRPSWRL